MQTKTTKDETCSDVGGRVDPLVSPQIIQLLMTPNDATWQGVLIGLGSDGVTYVCGPSGRWETYIPPLGYAS